MSGIINFPGARSGVISSGGIGYEEGTWVASMTTTATDFTTAGRGTGGFYVKIGDLVTVYADISITNPTSGTGNFIVSGLPFACRANHYVVGSASFGRIDGLSTYGSFAYLSAGTTYIQFQTNNDGGVLGQITASHLNGNTTPYMTLSMNYLA